MTAPTLRAQVLALRRTHSARAVAQALSIPLGTVKAISSRAGLTRDNAKLREFFRLPEPTASTCTALQPPVAPPEPVAVTGFLLPWGHHHVNLIDGQFVSILKTLANAGAVSMKHRICRDAVTGSVTAKLHFWSWVLPRKPAFWTGYKRAGYQGGLPRESWFSDWLQGRLHGNRRLQAAG